MTLRTLITKRTHSAARQRGCGGGGPRTARRRPVRFGRNVPASGRRRARKGAAHLQEPGRVSRIPKGCSARSARIRIRRRARRARRTCRNPDGYTGFQRIFGWKRPDSHPTPRPKGAAHLQGPGRVYRVLKPRVNLPVKDSAMTARLPSRRRYRKGPRGFQEQGKQARGPKGTALGRSS